ncbi:DUF6090 family protein [Muriicola sp. Z0-33]|uniref:DUF6090 family protein n=1 Tax=Muriicola sp. Z0-33 TaxID=2816957 RepID=UPI00223718CB|nr:DUF6090 family protein [Muriicola sp. Z0-33]MCW5515439.1 hypothetical protein [Muriicola sp. Z0-33]
MIKFFRKIRQQLLTENKLSKYLLYAIGEIVLVVIGILIALSINNWNEWRKDRIMEREVLGQLSESLTKNCEALEETIKAVKELNSSRAIITSAIVDKTPYSDSLEYHFFVASLDFRNTTLSYSGYEIFKNEGFSVLTSAKLRVAIVNLFESELKHFETNESEAIRDVYIEEVAKYMIHNFSNRRIPNDYASVQSNQSFLENLKAISEREDWLNGQRSRLLEKCRRVLQFIKEELEEE